MKFKIFFNEQKRSMDIACTKDSNEDIIFPKNTDQHINYPIPQELQNKIKKKLQDKVPQEYAQDFIDLIEEKRIIDEKRNQKIKEIREKYNPEIFKALEEFKLEFVEFFL